jgi:hypothetical protein
VSERLGGILLPAGVDAPLDEPTFGGGALIDNRTDLPDPIVEQAVQTHFIENSSMAWGHPNTFQTYANEGSLLTRSKFQTPSNVIDEIKLARDIAERDDDVGAAIGMMLAVAFSEGMQHLHEEERTMHLFNKIAKHANLDAVFMELYREWLISGQITTVSLYTPQTFDYRPEGADRDQRHKVASPLIGVLPAERIRVLDNDMFGTGTLAYDASDQPKLLRWLEEFFASTTTAARKGEMAREDRVSAALFTGQYDVPFDNDDPTLTMGKLFTLNRRMVQRSTMPKGGSKYPRPLLTSNFALVEAKRLLNLMDYALLQGGMNFIVVAKKGSDQRPAMPEEVTNLREVVRRASRTGVIVGDHRLSFEIITPNLDALLSKEKREMLGRRLVQRLLRTPEAPEDAGVEKMKSSIELVSRVIAQDRLAVRRHIEGNVYDEVVERNSVFRKGPAKVWFPKIVLQGTDGFNDLILKLRDRGDIPRRWAVDAAGMDYDAARHERKRELDRGDDEVLVPASVPFSEDGDPQDNGPGRPKGGSPNNGAPGARRGQGQDRFAPRRTVTRNAGETVRAYYDEVEDRTYRAGELTHALLEQYPDRKIGRLTPLESKAMDAGVPTREGPLAVIPVNPGYETVSLKAVRLADGLSILVGRKADGAIVSKGLVFREPEFTPGEAEERAIEWGFPVCGAIEAPPELPALPAPDAPEAPPQRVDLNLVIETEQGRVRKTIIRDEHGNVVGSREDPIEK